MAKETLLPAIRGADLNTVIVADGTPEMKIRLNRVLTNDPGTGVARHVDAGYEKAKRIAKERNLKVPML